MRIMCLSDIDKRQRHENKRLQGNNQNMENRPRQSGNNVEDEQNRIHCFNAAGSRPSTAKQGYQQEYQFARIHIAEQPHTV